MEVKSSTKVNRLCCETSVKTSAQSSSTLGAVDVVGASGVGPGEEEARQPMQVIKTITINRHERNFIVNPLLLYQIISFG
jgi:hypothetical protein